MHPEKLYNLLAILKDGEWYCFVYDDNSKAETLRTFGRFASNPDLNFTWYDAAILSKRMAKTPQQSL